MKTPRQIEFLSRLANLLAEFDAELTYTKDDDGVHVEMDRKDVCGGFHDVDDLRKFLDEEFAGHPPAMPADVKPVLRHWTQGPVCCSVTTYLDRRETDALDELSKLRGLSREGVFRCGLRTLDAVGKGAAELTWKDEGPSGCVGE